MDGQPLATAIAFLRRSWGAGRVSVCASALLFRCGLAALGLAAVYPAGAGELHWGNGPGYRSAALSGPIDEREGFTRLPGSGSGILFTNVLSKEGGARNQLRLAG